MDKNGVENMSQKKSVIIEPECLSIRTQLIKNDRCNTDNLNHIMQYIPRHMHTVFALLCFVVVIHWLIFPYPSGLLHWHCGNLTIAAVPAKQPWWIWINTSFEFIMNDYITTTKQITTKPCAYFFGIYCKIEAAGVVETNDILSLIPWTWRDLQILFLIDVLHSCCLLLPWDQSIPM